MMWFTLISSLFAGIVGANFMSRYAYRFGLIDLPNDRSSHNSPTPRGGGIGILIALIMSSLLIDLPLLVWLPASFLSVVSFFDDKLGLNAKIRLFFQFAAAFITISYVVEYNMVMQSFNSMHFLLGIIFSSVFIVGTANFYNFMDGINGIAGITGVVGFALLGLFANINSISPEIKISTFCMSAACLGFLPLNVVRARVFMGDVGSILLGFVFGAYVIILTRSLSDFMVLSGFLSTFYADALTTLYVRKKNGEQLFKAHRRHLYQLLANQKKIVHWKISASYGLIQLIIGLMLLLLQHRGWKVIAVFEILVMVLWLFVMARIRKNVE